MKLGLIKKLILWYAAILLAALTAMGLIVNGILNADNERVIEDDMLKLKSMCEVFINRSSLVDDWNLEGESAKYYEKVEEELYEILDREVALYTPDGEIICGHMTGLEEAQDGDITYATQGKSAYTIVMSGGQTTVYFAFPMKTASGFEVIVRIKSDYTVLYDRGTYIAQLVLYSAFAVIAIALVLLLVFAHHVISPVKKLRNAIQGLSKNPSHVHPIPVTRKDEIGELTREYNNMAAIIREQMRAIEQEKQMLRESIQYKKEFYDNITHELKTPLTIILGYGEMMKQTGFQDNDFNQKGIDQIITESRRLCDMVVGLLDASKTNESMKEQFVSVEICSLVSEIAASMNIKAKRYGMEIETTLSKEAWVLGSPDKLRQIFINLLDNAIKYSDGKRPIRVQVEKDVQVTVRVINSFEGEMNPAMFVKWFIPFYRQRDDEARGEKEKGSVGLGLAICKNIVDAHDGSISAKLVSKQEICFRVTLPLLKDEEAL